jgi:hypothetical protein
MLKFWRWNIGFERQLSKATLGVTNELSDVKGADAFFLMLDYDSTDYEVVCRDIMHLNRVFNMCHFFVTVNSEQHIGGKTIGNYAVWSADRLTYLQHMQVQEHTRCDANHRRFRNLSRRNWVLRVSAKYNNASGHIVRLKPQPRLKDYIKFPDSCPYKHSAALLALMEHWFGVKTALHNQDSGTELEFIQYPIHDDKGRKAPVMYISCTLGS